MLQVASCEFSLFSEQPNYFWMAFIPETLSSSAVLPFSESNPSYAPAARNSRLVIV